MLTVTGFARVVLLFPFYLNRGMTLAEARQRFQETLHSTKAPVGVSMSLWFAARSLAVIGIQTIPQTVGAASLASVIGFMAIFAPAGLGVHEAVYLLALKPMMGAAVAILAIMFRAMQVLLDVVVAGIGAGVMKREVRDQSSEIRDQRSAVGSNHE